MTSTSYLFLDGTDPGFPATLRFLPGAVVGVLALEPLDEREVVVEVAHVEPHLTDGLLVKSHEHLVGATSARFTLVVRPE